MTKNPFYNSGLAIFYIVLVVLLINFGSQLAGSDSESNLLAPIGMISLFVVSAAVMAYIVLYQPITMFLDGKRKDALTLFWRTIGIFATVALLILVTAIIIL